MSIRPWGLVRKRWWSLLLPLVLLLSQQGALLHELGHLRAALPSAAPAHGEPSTPQPGSAAHAVCALCLGFDHLANAAVAIPPTLEAVPAPHAWTSAPAPAWRAADSPTARSRGPPTVL